MAQLDGACSQSQGRRQKCRVKAAARIPPAPGRGWDEQEIRQHHDSPWERSIRVAVGSCPFTSALKYENTPGERTFASVFSVAYVGEGDVVAGLPWRPGRGHLRAQSACVKSPHALQSDAVFSTYALERQVRMLGWCSTWATQAVTTLPGTERPSTNRTPDKGGNGSKYHKLNNATSARATTHDGVFNHLITAD